VPLARDERRGATSGIRRIFQQQRKGRRAPCPGRRKQAGPTRVGARPSPHWVAYPSSWSRCRKGYERRNQQNRARRSCPLAAPPRQGVPEHHNASRHLHPIAGQVMESRGNLLVPWAEVGATRRVCHGIAVGALLGGPGGRARKSLARSGLGLEPSEASWLRVTPKSGRSAELGLCRRCFGEP
jgi:hypothetical protein